MRAARDKPSHATQRDRKNYHYYLSRTDYYVFSVGELISLAGY